MKTLITLVIAFFLLQPVTAFSNPPEKWIVARFQHDFPDASDVIWSDHETKYEVTFKKDSIKCRLFINKKDGSEYALMRYYTESELAPKIQKKLHNFLRHADIYGVIEVEMDQKTGYQVVMKNDQHTYIVIVDSKNNITLQNVYDNK